MVWFYKSHKNNTRLLNRIVLHFSKHQIIKIGSCIYSALKSRANYSATLVGTETYSVNLLQRGTSGPIEWYFIYILIGSLPEDQRLKLSD